MQQMRLLPRLLNNDATVFVVVVVGPCHQDGGRGEEAITPANAPAITHGGRDTEIKEFRCRHLNCSVYIDRAVRDGSTDAQGQRRGVSPINNKDDDGSDNDNDNWGRCRDA